MTIEARRTPDERFTGLLPWEPGYLEWEGLRLHYVDAGSGAPVVMFHGEPTWAFLYRKMAGVLLDAGYRVVIPDLPGFGRSDKPVDPAFYTYDRHTAAMEAVLEHLALDEATAVVQDWGGPIGLRLAVGGRFDRICLLNTALFTGGARPSRGFLEWRTFVERTEEIDVGRLMRASMVRPWPDEVIAAYDAPFPDASFKAGVHRFPLIVPLAAGDPGAAKMAAVLDALGRWERPALVLFSTDDPVFPTSVGERLAAHIPGAGPLRTVEGAGHFLQEDAGEEVGAAVAGFLAATG